MAVTTIPSAGLTLGAQVNFRNLIINGDMSIHQRGTNATATNQYGVDRFYYNDAQNFDQRVFTFGQDTDVPTGQGFAKSMKVNVTTPETTIASDEYALITTRLEGQNLQQLKFGSPNAEQVTLSFWLKTNVTGNFNVNLKLDDDNRVIGKTYSATSSGVWEKITLTFDADTTGVIDNDNGSGLRVMFILDAGSNFTSSDNTSWGTYSNAKLGYGQTASVFGTTSGYWNVTGLQLEVGTSASDFEFIPFDVNLQRCKRYYESFGTFGDYLIGYGYGSGSDTARTSFPFTVEKRATPTMADVSSSRQVRINWTSSDGTAVNQNSTTQATFSEPNIKNSGYVQIGGYSSIGGGQNGFCRMNNATTTYEADAEL